MRRHVRRYVLGFYFVDDKVALIRKTKPSWIAGKLNGLGGKILPGEMPIAAMVREFREESGIITFATHWKPLTCLVAPEWEIVVFYGEGKGTDLLTTTFTSDEGTTEFWDGIPNSFERIDNTALALLHLIRDVRSVGYDLTDSLPSVEPRLLTPKESEIARYVSNGMSNSEIADRLVIETSTVKNHVHNILHKLGVPRRKLIASAIAAMQG